MESEQKNKRKNKTKTSFYLFSAKHVQKLLKFAFTIRFEMMTRMIQRVEHLYSAKTTNRRKILVFSLNTAKESKAATIRCRYFRIEMNSGFLCCQMTSHSVYLFSVLKVIEFLLQQ